jgi:hypothetical protein
MPPEYVRARFDRNFASKIPALSSAAPGTTSTSRQMQPGFLPKLFSAWRETWCC